jgi:hypothetical protein
LIAYCVGRKITNASAPIFTISDTVLAGLASSAGSPGGLRYV